MAYAMQPGPSSMVPGANTQPPAALRSVAAGSDDKEAIRIYGHNWLLKKTDAKRLYLCSVCPDAAAEATLCGRTSHAVCVACFTAMESHQIVSCPSCREPFLPSEHRTLHDSFLQQHQQRMLQDVAWVDCAQCKSWSGVEDGMARHAQQCGPGWQPCPWSGAGCRWRGPQEQQAVHSRRCDWRTVTCSMQGCAQQFPLCQRQEHEAGCVCRLGVADVLDTVLGQPWEILFDNFFQQPVDSSEDISLSERIARLEHRMSVLSALGRFFRNDLPAGIVRTDSEDSEDSEVSEGSEDSEVSEGSEGSEVSEVSEVSEDSEGSEVSEDREGRCLWDCGFHGRLTQMAEHHMTCPLFPEMCRFCPQTVPRSDLNAHLASCPDRPECCPFGCGQPGLRARDIEDGSHARICTANRALVCGDCQTLVPLSEPSYRFRAQRLEEHRQECPQRPMSCRWCLGCHPFTGFDARQASCRAWVKTHAPGLEGRPLVLQPGARGPVYVRSRGDDDAVFIRFPQQTLERERESETYARNLTGNLRFGWSGMRCELDFFCTGSFGICFRVLTSTLSTDLMASASLRLDDGTLIQQWGAEDRLGFHDLCGHGLETPTRSTGYCSVDSLDEEIDRTVLESRDWLLQLQAEGRRRRL